MASLPRQDFGYSRTVSYTNSRHFSVITQRWGSINQKVAPFCLANILLSVVLVFLLNHGIDLSISEFGHDFMSVLVAFLVINKLSFTLGLYYELQGYLSKMNQSAVELTLMACSLTSGYRHEEIKEWRYQVTKHTLLILKAVVSVIHKGNGSNVWELPEIRNIRPQIELVLDEEMGNILMTRDLFKQGVTSRNHPEFKPVPEELYVWGHHLQSDKNLRVPIRLAQRLRDEIMKHQRLKTDPIDTIQERILLDYVKEFMDSYCGVRKYLTCPLPLPLVQLGRIFVICYVFTLPFALLSSGLNLKYGQMICLTTLMTYGYMGLELLFVEIDDPFAQDPNDLPLTEESRAAGEDILLSLLHTDGKDSASRLAGEFAFESEQKDRPPKTYAKETDRLV